MDGATRVASGLRGMTWGDGGRESRDWGKVLVWDEHEEGGRRDYD